jgi:hypothetical protein
MFQRFRRVTLVASSDSVTGAGVGKFPILFSIDILLDLNARRDCVQLDPPPSDVTGL